MSGQDGSLLQAVAELEKLLGEIEGHVTLFRFTTGWKVIQGTPDIDLGPNGDYCGGGRHYMGELPDRMTLADAIKDCRENGRRFPLD